MSPNEQLIHYSVEELRRELHARQSKPNDQFAEIDDVTLVKSLKADQKVIYGTDDRQDLFEITQRADLADADSVVALFDAADVTDNGNGTSTLRTVNFGVKENLCPGEPFRDQPIGAFCSGFLVASNIIATAGHCATFLFDITHVRFVFGFRMRNAATPETVINNGEIYSAVRIIGRQQQSTGPDWALVQIDRDVTNHRIATIRRSGKIPDNQAVHVIGHPRGLPTKFAGNATVRDNHPAAFFVANLDTYGGNSGSPVFNSRSHIVEGVLVRGETDFVPQGDCMISLVCPTTGCRGEDCTRTTEFANLLPQNPVTDPAPKHVEDGANKLARDIAPKPLLDIPNKRIQDANKQLADNIGKQLLEPLPGMGSLRPFSLSTAHHTQLVGGSAEEGETTNLSLLERQWLDLKAALAQTRATIAQAEVDAARLEDACNAVAAEYADLLNQSAANEGQ